MIVAAALLVFTVGGIAVLAFSLATGSGDARRSVFGGSGIAIALAGGAGVVVFVVVALGVIGIDSGEDDEAAPNAPTHTTLAPEVVATTTTPLSVAPRPSSPVAGREVRMQAIGAAGFPLAPEIVANLAPAAVLRVLATGFEEYDTGVIEQCDATRCANAFPVTFDSNGSARFQYLVRADLIDSTTPTCRNARPCVVRLKTSTSRALLTTVFGAPAPPPQRVVVTPAPRNLATESVLTVSVDGFTAGEQVRATVCAAPDTSGTARCGAPAPAANLTIGADGTGRTTLTVREGRVGSDRVSCTRDTPCGIVVNGASTPIPGPAVPMTFASTSAHYEPTRVLTGLLLAALLLGLAVYLIRRTDWRKPTEADTPDMDHAVLAE